MPINNNYNYTGMTQIVTGYKRSLKIVVNKTIDGVIAAGYPKYYPTALDVLNGYFALNGINYTIPSQEQLGLMEQSEYDVLLLRFKQYVSLHEPGLSFSQDIVNSPEIYAPEECYQVTTTTTPVPVTTTTTTEELVTMTTTEASGEGCFIGYPKFSDIAGGKLVSTLNNGHNALICYPVELSPNFGWTQAQAIAYVEGLTLNGYSDWRVPTIEEWEILGNSIWAVAQGLAFDQWTYYWSSTGHDAEYGWIWTTGSGTVAGVEWDYYNIASLDYNDRTSAWVRPVRTASCEDLNIVTTTTTEELITTTTTTDELVTTTTTVEEETTTTTEAVDYCTGCYGLLYNWYTTQGVSGSSISSSDNWVVPSYQDALDFMGIMNPAGGNKVRCRKLSLPHPYWKPNIEMDGANNSSKLSFWPAGMRYKDGSFAGLTEEMYIWTTEGWEWMGDTYARDLYALYNYADLYDHHTAAEAGKSIRLINKSTLLDEGEIGQYVGNDGRVYETVVVNGWEWLRENLSETKLRNGNYIPEVTDDAQWGNTSNPALCAYDHDWSYSCAEKPDYPATTTTTTEELVTTTTTPVLETTTTTADEIVTTTTTPVLETTSRIHYAHKI